jgi:hypothetical protein
MSQPEEIWSSQTGHVGFLESVAGGASLLLTVPAYLWHHYVEYLWHYDKHPWILSASATFQLLAVILLAPFVLLSLLVSPLKLRFRSAFVVGADKMSVPLIRHLLPDIYHRFTMSSIFSIMFAHVSLFPLGCWCLCHSTDTGCSGNDQGFDVGHQTLG